MQLRKHTYRVIHKSVALLLILSQATQPAQAASMSKLMSLSGFTGLVAAIANLNKAMRDAAENPMDQWRRQNVRHAMGMMPLAIRGLAAEFAANKLHDSDLPMVQKMLGGFIEVNAADNYKKFLANPDKRLIPQVGKDFPGSIGNGKSGQGNSSGLVFNDNVNKTGNFASNEQATPSGMSPKVTEQLINLDSVSAAPTPSANRETQTLAFDDSVKKGSVQTADLTTGSTERWIPAGSLNNGASPSSLEQANRDLASIESQVGTAATTGSNPGLEVRKKDKADEDDFFAESKPKKKEKKSKRTDYRLSPKPKYWTMVPLVKLFLVPEAKAEEGGGKAAEFLFGLAAIMAAAAPMVAAAIQADADKTIAKTNADAQITMTKISADTSRKLADQQKEIALQQAQTAQDISEKNQSAVTERLAFQLNELRSARQEASQVEEKKRQYQQELDQQRIQLAQQQADATQKLAATQLRAQLTAAGLSQGFTRSTDSSAGGSLNVSRGSGVASTATASAASAGTTRLAQAVGGSGLGLAPRVQTPAAMGVAPKDAGLMAANNETAVRAPVSAARGRAARAAAKLLSNVESDDESLDIECTIDKKGKKICPKASASVGVRRGVTGKVPASRGIRRGVSAEPKIQGTSTVSKDLNQVMLSNPARGVTRTDVSSTTRTRNESDLSRFVKSASDNGRVGLSEFMDQEAVAHNRQLGRGVAAAAETPRPAISGAYNAPSVDVSTTPTATFGSHRGMMEGSLR